MPQTCGFPICNQNTNLQVKHIMICRFEVSVAALVIRHLQEPKENRKRKTEHIDDHLEKGTSYIYCSKNLP